MKKAFFLILGVLRKKENLKLNIQNTFKDILNIHFLETEKTLGALSICKKAIKENADIIIVCGGDGSINEMVNGYLNSTTSKKIKFGVIPLGTGNDFVKSLKLTKSLNLLKEFILQDKIVAVDIFKMNFTNLNKQRDSRFFINISDIGIGGYVAENISNSSKFLGSNLSYFKAIVMSFLKYKKQNVSLKSKNFNWKGPIMSISMANGKYFGSGMGIAPDAKLNDQKLELTILGDVSLLDYLKNLANLKKVIKIKHPEVIYISVKNCKISSLDKEECPIDMDGEFIGHTPIEVNLFEKNILFYGLD